MKIILSRKGFDSANGGIPSPIMPDGTMLSLPIPSDDNLSFDDLQYKEQPYGDIIRQLSPKWKSNRKGCHLDPDIREGVRIKGISGWCPAFGQTEAAESHLRSNAVSDGDIFLFFGWFRQTEIHKGKLRFIGPYIQAIYGYMQIEKRLTGNDLASLSWHPHARYAADAGNSIYTTAKRLVINGKDLGNGYGLFTFDEQRLQLTKPGMSRSRWSILPFMLGDDFSMTYHTKDSVKNGYFQSAARGQEFVMNGTESVLQWVFEIFTGTESGL